MVGSRARGAEPRQQIGAHLSFRLTLESWPRLPTEFLGLEYRTKHKHSAAWGARSDLVENSLASGG